MNVLYIGGLSLRKWIAAVLRLLLSADRLLFCLTENEWGVGWDKKARLEVIHTPLSH